MADEFSLLSTVQEWYFFFYCAHQYLLIDIFPWRWVKKTKSLLWHIFLYSVTQCYSYMYHRNDPNTSGKELNSAYLWCYLRKAYMDRIATSFDWIIHRILTGWHSYLSWMLFWWGRHQRENYLYLWNAQYWFDFAKPSQLSKYIY